MKIRLRHLRKIIREALEEAPRASEDPEELRDDGDVDEEAELAEDGCSCTASGASCVVRSCS